MSFCVYVENNTFDQLEPFDLKIIKILDGWEIFQRSLAHKVFLGIRPSEFDKRVASL